MSFVCVWNVIFGFDVKSIKDGFVKKSLVIGSNLINKINIWK